MSNLKNKTISLPSPDGKSTVKLPIKELGISFPMLVESKRPGEDDIALPGFGQSRGGGPRGRVEGDGQPKVTVLRYDFAIQFCWKETPLSERLQKQKAEANQGPATQGGNHVAAPMSTERR